MNKFDIYLNLIIELIDNFCHNGFPYLDSDQARMLDFLKSKSSKKALFDPINSIFYIDTKDKLDLVSIKVEVLQSRWNEIKDSLNQDLSYSIIEESFDVMFTVIANASMHFNIERDIPEITASQIASYAYVKIFNENGSHGVYDYAQVKEIFKEVISKNQEYLMNSSEDNFRTAWNRVKPILIKDGIRTYFNKRTPMRNGTYYLIEIIMQDYDTLTFFRDCLK